MVWALGWAVGRREREKERGLQKAAEQKGELMKVTKFDTLPSLELFI
jgi:hypothetical protein